MPITNFTSKITDLVQQEDNFTVNFLEKSFTGENIPKKSTVPIENKK